MRLSAGAPRGRPDTNAAASVSAPATARHSAAVCGSPPGRPPRSSASDPPSRIGHDDPVAHTVCRPAIARSPVAESLLIAIARRSVRVNVVAVGYARGVKVIRRLPILRLIAIAKLALVAKRHLDHLTPAERRRLAKLVRRPHNLTSKEQKDLRRLVGKLDLRAFAGSTADRFSPLPLPRRLTKARY